MTSSVPTPTTTKIKKLLIANRGEIAVRIIRAAKDAGIPTVAVYAEQDRNALHVRLADEAYALHGDTPATSYLSVRKLLSVAQRSGANAVHPGYGFLSENAGFAQAVIDADLIWIGPSPHAIDLLGDKVSARHIAQQVGAPLAPGTSDPVTTSEEIEAFAEQVGLPIAIKAAFGGGGRGMRIVREGDSIAEQFDAATREAIAAFGRGECFVEKFLDRPRHVETQCLADAYGNVMVVSTRDCSLQRRNQKLVEEAPAPFISTDQHDRLVHASKAILKAAGYQSAGTCEFLIGLDGTISFLEVNTRLQVEHTVSEEVTGLDLVREQFKIAEGGVISEDSPVPHAHSIEFRINGEDPGSGFLPRQGTITTFKQPEGPGVRVDTGVEAGDVIGGAFDSMMAKLIVTGRDRNEALERARRALAEFEVTGVPTVIPFDRAVVDDPAFTAADGHFGVYTTWIDTAFDNRIPAWDGVSEVTNDVDQDRTNVVLEVNDKRVEISLPKRLVEGDTGALMRPAPKRRFHSVAGGKSAGTMTAPMQATVTKVEVSEGDHVVTGDTLLVLEAMKMEQPLAASKDGIVTNLDATPGQTVSAGHVLLTIADES